MSDTRNNDGSAQQSCAKGGFTPDLGEKLSWTATFEFAHGNVERAKLLKEARIENRRLRKALEIARAWVPFSHNDTIRINVLVYGEDRP